MAEVGTATVKQLLDTAAFEHEFKRVTHAINRMIEDITPEAISVEEEWEDIPEEDVRQVEQRTPRGGLMAVPSLAVDIEVRIRRLRLAKWLTKPALLILRGRAAVWWTNLCLRVVRTEWRTKGGSWRRVKGQLHYETVLNEVDPG